MKVLFNTEGNKSIGMGAFYDCLALAKRFKEKLNPQIKFFISHESEEEAEEALLKGYDMERVDMGEAGAFLNSIKEYRPDIIVQNLLDMKKDHMDELSGLKAKIVDILHTPDFGDRLKADIVINLLYDSSKVRCLYGPRYAILDDKFKNLGKRTIKDVAADLLVSFGGSDVNNLTLKLVKVLDRLGLDFQANLVIGAGFGDDHKLRRCLDGLANKERFRVNKKVTDMAGLISASDLAFVSGGRTVCELAAAGTPGIVFAQNELEYGRLKEFRGWGSVLAYGYFGDDEKLIPDIKKVILDKALREKMSRKGQELVDGKGVDRIIEAILGGTR